MKTILIALIIILLASNVFAIGEIFRVETVGTEYCGDYNYSRFTHDNNIDLWVYVVSENEILVSLTPYFEESTSFPMYGETYLTGKTSASFVGGVLFVDYSYATIQGTVKFDKNGTVKSLKGVFIQNGVIHPNCFSSGKFKTVERLW